MLTDLQKDLLKEYINVFLGQAANMLSEMANQRVLLNVPEIALIDLSEESSAAQHPLHLFSHGHIVSSSMKFGHDFSGKAMLIFPAAKAKLLVDACMGEATAPDTITASDLADTDFDVLREISNVILNSVIGEFGNLLETRLEFSLPDVELVFVSQDEQETYLKHNVYMLMLYTKFTLAEAQIDGIVIVALGMNSLNMLLSKLDHLLEGFHE